MKPLAMYNLERYVRPMLAIIGFVLMAAAVLYFPGSSDG